MGKTESSAAGTAVRIGLCGFTISMKVYASRFPVVEIQRTFYEPPSDARLQRCPTAENVRAMRRFFERMKRPRARLLWEPRGKAWVTNRAMALALCADLDLVYVVDPFVTAPPKGRAVYWRLHGLGGARHSYSDDELRDLHGLLVRSESSGPAYVLFNNLPRAGDAQRFARLVEAGHGGKRGPGPNALSGPS